jgi:3-methyladenine DNA glycosylase AlkD
MKSHNSMHGTRKSMNKKINSSDIERVSKNIQNTDNDSIQNSKTMP